MKNYRAYIQFNTEEKWYQGFIPGIPGAEARGSSMVEMKENLRKALAKCLRDSEHSGIRKESAKPARYPGFRRIDLEV